MDRASLCTFCADQNKADRRKHSKFDRSGTVRRPEHGENPDLTRRASRSCKFCMSDTADEETKYRKV